MSDQAVFLSKWSPNEIIILAKEQPGHSYTFWTMPILIFSPFANFGKHSLVLKNRSFFIRKNFSTKNKVILYDALQNLKYSKIAQFPMYKRSLEPLQMLRHILWKRKYIIILCRKKGWKIFYRGTRKVI